MLSFQAVTARGGRFLEAPVIGSKQPSSNGSLIILAAGDKTLYDDCYSCFEAMGKKTFYLGMDYYTCFRYSAVVLYVSD